MRSPPEPPELGPLPPELMARILLLLPLLDRVRAEGTSRGWCAFLRASEHHTRLDSRAVLRACGVEGRLLRLSGADGEAEAEAEADPLSTGHALAALAERAGAHLRALTVTGDAHLTAMLPVLSDAPPALEELRVSGAKAETLTQLLDALGEALPPLLEADEVLLGISAMQAHVAPAPDGLGEDDSAACRLLLCSVDGRLSLRMALPFVGAVEDAVEDADEFEDDVRAVRCLRLGRLLALSNWQCVRLALPHEVAAEFEDDAAALATLCETLLAGMADDGVAGLPAVSPATFVFDMHNSHLDARQAARVAAAAPPHARLLLSAVYAIDHNAAALLRALRPGRVAAARLVIESEEIDAAQLTAALAALLAAAVAVQDEEPLECDGFTLQLDSYLTTDVLAMLCAWLRAHPRALAGLQLYVADAVQMLALLAALVGSQLRRLTLRGRGNEQSLLALAAALKAGELPHLVRLQMLPGWALTEASSQALAKALRRRNSRFELRLPQMPLAAAVPALRPLIRTAHPASGVPLDAVHLLLQAAAAEVSSERQPAATCAVATRFALFEIIQLHCDRCFDAEAVEHDETPQALGDVAALLLHAVALLPSASTAFTLRPTARMLLLSACVRHARWPGAAAGALNFTPLLHRALLLWSRFGRDADATPRVLGDIVAVCMRDLPSEDAAPAAMMEARFALCSVLLACGLASDGCTDDPRLAAASTWLATHFGWLLQVLFPPLRSNDRTSRAVEDPLLESLPGLSAGWWNDCDVALHLSALLRVPALRAALWRSRAFPQLLHRALRANWQSLAPRVQDDAPEIAAAVAYTALANLLVKVHVDELRYLKMAWLVTEHADKRRGAPHTHSMMSVVEEALMQNQERLQQAALPDSSGRLQGLPAERCAAAEVAASHVQAALGQLRRIAPPLTTAQTVQALASVLATLPLAAGAAEADAHAAHACLTLLRGILLQCARDSAATRATLTGASLAAVMRACAPLLPTWEGIAAESAPAVLVTLLACSMTSSGAAGASTSAEADLVTVTAAAEWLARPMRVFLLLQPLTARAPDALDAHTAAQYLSAAAHVPGLGDSLLVNSPAVEAVATDLLLRQWTQPCAPLDPSGALTAAVAYGALARMLLSSAVPNADADTCPLATLVRHWRSADAAMAQCHGGGAASEVGTQRVLTHLSRELSRCCELRARTHANAAASAAAEVAMTHLSALQLQALMQLQKWRAGDKASSRAPPYELTVV